MARPTLWNLGGGALALASARAAGQAAMGGAGGFAYGFAHPLTLTQPDHMLVMIAVGLLGVQLGGRAVWLLPASFVSFTTGGEVLGFLGFSLPFAEIGIAVSVVALGLIIATRMTVPTFVAAGLVGVFAVFHGHAHVTEMPLGVSATGYAAGFLTATAALHGTGVWLGMMLARKETGSSKRVTQLGGAGMALTGVALAAALL